MLFLVMICYHKYIIDMQETPLTGVNYHTKSSPPYNLFYPPHERVLSDEQIKTEMRVIKEQLHCNAVRIVGQSTEELIRVGQLAESIGLSTWYSPRYINASFADTVRELSSFCKEAHKKGISNSTLIVANELPYDCNDIMGVTIRDYRKRVQYYVDNFLKKGEWLIIRIK